MKLSSVSTMNHLIDFDVCAHILLFYILTLKRYFNCILGVHICCYIVRAQLLGERPKEKYSTAKQLNGQRVFEIV